MKVDPEVWLLATAGAALMATGGAFLRSAFAGPRAAEPPPPATSLLCLLCSQRPPTRRPRPKWQRFAKS